MIAVETTNDLKVGMILRNPFPYEHKRARVWSETGERNVGLSLVGLVAHKDTVLVLSVEQNPAHHKLKLLKVISSQGAVGYIDPWVLLDYEILPGGVQSDWHGQNKGELK